MILSCPYCEKQPDHVIDFRTIVRHGGYYRTSDSRPLKRYRCLTCRRTFSDATRDECFGEKKRQKNRKVRKLFCSGVSMRQIARVLHLNRTTVGRKLKRLGAVAREGLTISNANVHVYELQFDDLETMEHTKMKPVSVTLAVDGKTRRVLDFRVASMPAKGLLAKRAIKKYGFRKDERSKMRKELFEVLRPIIKAGTLIKSDSNPYYAPDVKRYFPDCPYETCIGQRGSVTGSGELKKIRFDPIFSLNHTCAMMRAHISRLVRKTWCTTKSIDRLIDHIAIYAVYHNERLKI